MKIAMFQTFDSPPAGADRSERVARLRDLMAKGGLDAVLVPRADEHQGEYVPPCAERLAWLTGFTGSAGLAVIARTAAALFVDGRYTVQAPAQVDGRQFEIIEIPGARVSEWLERKLAAGAVVGFDPWLHSANAIEELAKAVGDKGIKLKPLARNLVDRVWGKARPAPPKGPVVAHALKYAGKPADQKISELQALLQGLGVVRFGHPVSKKSGPPGGPTLKT